MNPRPPALPEADARALRVQCKLSVDSVGGPYSAATALGYGSQGNISASTDPNDWSRWMRVDHAVLLDRLAGYPYVTACMARLVGCLLVPQVAAETCGVRAIGEMLRDLGRLVGEAAIALVDHKLTAAERASLLPLLERCAAAIATAHATLSQAQPEE